LEWISGAKISTHVPSGGEHGRVRGTGPGHGQASQSYGGERPGEFLEAMVHVPPVLVREARPVAAPDPVATLRIRAGTELKQY
jgi:hypothetical protein